jgi:DNA-binding GntR family transcriptional regulator
VRGWWCCLSASRMKGERMSTQRGVEVVPIQRRSLHEAVASKLRDLIIEGQLAAGARLVETELGLKLGVSRTPLREAIRTLASEGLVDLVPAKGAVVRRFSLDDVRHMLEAIAVLEQFAARQACARASDAEVEAIARLHRAMMVQYRRRKRLAYYKLNQAVHSAIVLAAHNPEIADMHERLQARMKRIRYVGNHEPEKWACAVAEHEEMIAALGRRDDAALAEVLGRHLSCTFDRVRDVI